jgi:hypothetical protein
MVINFKDIEEAFDFVSFGDMYDHQAFLDKETGKIYWHSEVADDLEELPEDIDDEKYIEIPHKKELDLGKNLVLDFASQFLPDEYEEVESIFRRKGAYSNFKELLVRKGIIDKWYEFQSQAEEKALRAWCKDNDIEIHD